MRDIPPMLMVGLHRLGIARWPHTYYRQLFQWIGYGFYFWRGADNDNDNGAMLPADSED